MTNHSPESDPLSVFSQPVYVGMENNPMATQVALYDPEGLARSRQPDALTLPIAFERYLNDTGAKAATRAEYKTTLNRWRQWCELPRNLHRCTRPMQVTEFDYENCKAFLDWCYQSALHDGSNNAGRVHNQRRANLSAVLRWLADPETGAGVEISVVPTLPKPKEQRSEAGLYYLEEGEINAIYWQTYRLRARGWKAASIPIGAYWRAALVFFYNYGVDTGTVFAYVPRHRPLLWRHVYDSPICPDRSVKLPEGLEAEYGWIHYTRTKTSKSFVRPMNRVVREHLESIQPPGNANDYADKPVFRGGSARPNDRFTELWTTAGVQQKLDPETGELKDWEFKDLRKTAATWHDANVPGAGSPILGHAIDGSASVTARHYSSAGPLLAARSLLTMPQPEAFRSIYDEEIRPPAMLFVK